LEEIMKKSKTKQIQPYGAYQIPGPIIYDITNSFTKEVYDSLFDNNVEVSLYNNKGDNLIEKLPKQVQKRSIS